jgi:HEAT repeat protein
MLTLHVMVRRGFRLGALVWVVPLLALARDKSADAAAAIAAFESGAMSATQAATRIGNAGNEAAATTYLTRRLEQVFEPRRRASYFELLSMVAVPHRDLAELAVSTLKTSDDLSVRLSAMRIVARMKHPDLVPILVPYLGDPLLGLRREAARSLITLKAVRAAPMLAKAAVVEDDPETRSLMLVGVGRLGDAKQGKVLEPLLDSSSETTRLAATQALCLLGQKKGFDAAKKLLASPEKFDRLQGVMLFEGADAKVANAVLEPLTTDPEAAVRARAARVLAEGGDTRWTEWLVLEAFKGNVEHKLVFEAEIEKLRLSDEQRAAVLKKAGLK